MRIPSLPAPPVRRQIRFAARRRHELGHFQPAGRGRLRPWRHRRLFHFSGQTMLPRAATPRTAGVNCSNQRRRPDDYGTSNSKSFWVCPMLASKHGAEVDKLIIYVHCLMAALFVGWIFYFVYALLRFNSKANPKADYVGIRGHASNYIEGAWRSSRASCWSALPFRCGPGRWTSHFPTGRRASRQHPHRRAAVQLERVLSRPGRRIRASGYFAGHHGQSVGHRQERSEGQGRFHDAESISTSCVNRPVIITLTSKDVIHSFKVIAMRVTQDAIPGVPIPMHFTPDQGRACIRSIAPSFAASAIPAWPTAAFMWTRRRITTNGSPPKSKPQPAPPRVLSNRRTLAHDSAGTFPSRRKAGPRWRTEP